MIDSVPLIQNANDAQQINASIIAMKKASRELDEKIGKLNSLNSELDKKIALLDSGLNKEIEDRKEAINSLDVASVGGSGKYISAISETDGKISATASDITSTVSSGNSQPVTSGGVAEAISVPTNAVLHYSFDDVPDYPDGTSIYKKDKDWTTTDGWYPFSYNGTISVENGILTSTRDDSHVSSFERNFSISANTILKVRLIDTSNTDVVIFAFSGGYTTLKTVSLKANVPSEVVVNITNASTRIMLRNLSVIGAGKLQILSIYIGDGSYSTPIIDNANGQNNATNNGGIAVQGVSGKAIRFLGSNYIRGNLPWKPNVQKVFTVSGWIVNWDKTVDLHFINDWITVAVANFMIDLSAADSLSVGIDSPTDEGNIRFGINSTTLNWNNYSGKIHIVGVLNGSNTKFYVNGVSVPLYVRTTTTLSDTIKNRNVFEMGRIYANNTYSSKATIDDLLIFDRALTDVEVQALYLNKANTPKYYSWADWKLSNT